MILEENGMITYFFIKPLCLAFKIIGNILIYTFAIAVSLIVLPFYGIYRLCGGKPPKPKKAKKDNDSWRSRYEWVAGYLWD